jgi:nitrogen regulatory protein PII
MKTLIVMLRRDRVAPSAAALRKMGIACMAFFGVKRYSSGTYAACTQNLYFSRHHWARKLLPEDTASSVRQDGRKGNRPFRTGMLLLFTGDEQVNAVVQVIIDTNRPGHTRGGEIYICPMVAALDP